MWSSIATLLTCTVMSTHPMHSISTTRQPSPAKISNVALQPRSVRKTLQVSTNATCAEDVCNAKTVMPDSTVCANSEHDACVSMHAFNPSCAYWESMGYRMSAMCGMFCNAGCQPYLQDGHAASGSRCNTYWCPQQASAELCAKTLLASHCPETCYGTYCAARA